MNSLVPVVVAGIVWVLASRSSAQNIDEGEPAFTVNIEPEGTWMTDDVGVVDVSQNGVDFIKAREGFSATPYFDHKGNSIGYGHLIKPGEDLTFVTREQAEDILWADLEWAIDAVNKNVSAALTQGQFDALVSFVFNIGEPRFAASTLVRMLNEGNLEAVNQFPRWLYASGKVDQGLVNRRKLEVELFLS